MECQSCRRKPAWLAHPDWHVLSQDRGCEVRKERQARVKAWKETGFCSECHKKPLEDFEPSGDRITFKSSKDHSGFVVWQMGRSRETSWEEFGVVQARDGGGTDWIRRAAEVSGFWIFWEGGANRTDD